MKMPVQMGFRANTKNDKSGGLCFRSFQYLIQFETMLKMEAGRTPRIGCLRHRSPQGLAIVFSRFLSRLCCRMEMTGQVAFERS
jgi:hypothetical protein